MEITLARIGIVCILAAIAGGTLKALSFEIGAIESLGRQLILGGFGLLLIFVHWLREQGDAEAERETRTYPLLVMIVGGALFGIAYAALLSAMYAAAKAGALSPLDIVVASRRAVVDGHVAQVGAALGVVCGASWSLLQRRIPGAAVTMVILAGALLGWSCTELNPPGLRFETPGGAVNAAAVGAMVSLVVVLALRRLRV